jgi:hypothetical protein
LVIFDKSIIMRFCSANQKGYSDDPKPEYDPKKNRVNMPRAAKPPTVATIQRGTRPISLIVF